MFFLLIQKNLPWLEGHRLGFLRVFTFPTFQATAAILLSFILSVAFGPRVIAWLRRQKVGDLPSFDQVDIDRLMKDKAGTPTMGGILIIGAIFVTTVLLADLRNFYVQMGLLCLVLLGGVGAVDDWLKLTAKRTGRGRDGLSPAEKLLFQIGLSVILCAFTFHLGKNMPESHTLYFPFFKTWEVELSMSVFVLIGTIVLTGSSNAVNLTDGLDGLASGTMSIVSFAFVILTLIIGTLPWASYLLLPYIKASDQMAILAGAMMGACLGFLWFNCHPASVFMGDTGSLALGGLIGYIAIVIRQELTLFLVGGIYVVEAISVLIQRYYFKYTRLKFGEGRRFFLVAPLHHHFQKKGWTEQQVVVRFWLIGAILAAMALATVKLR